jgi:hypothetical protein
MNSWPSHQLGQKTQQDLQAISAGTDFAPEGAAVDVRHVLPSQNFYADQQITVELISRAALNGACRVHDKHRPCRSHASSTARSQPMECRVCMRSPLGARAAGRR